MCTASEERVAVAVSWDVVIVLLQCLTKAWNSSVSNSMSRNNR